MPRTGPETLLRRASDSPREENRRESGSTCREARRRKRARWRRGGTGVARARGSRAESAARTRGGGRGVCHVGCMPRAVGGVAAEGRAACSVGNSSVYQSRMEKCFKQSVPTRRNP